MNTPNILLIFSYKGLRTCFVVFLCLILLCQLKRICLYKYQRLFDCSVYNVLYKVLEEPFLI